MDTQKGTDSKQCVENGFWVIKEWKHEHIFAFY